MSSIASSPRKLICAAALFLVVAAEGGAQTVTHLYRAGESDSGAANGTAFGTTTDGVGSSNLGLLGTGGAYSSATSAPGSSLAFNFSGTSNFSGTVDTTLTNGQSFALEVWFNTNNTAQTSAFIYNGDTGASGIGLFQIGNHLGILAGGAIFSAGNGSLTSGTWNHAALVYDTGTIRLYLNGTLDFTTGGSFNNPSSGGISIGGSSSGGDRFAGLIDEARIFTFSAGTFDSSMLGYSAIPEPSTYAAMFGAAALGLAVWRRRNRRAAGEAAPRN